MKRAIGILAVVIVAVAVGLVVRVALHHGSSGGEAGTTVPSTASGVGATTTSPVEIVPAPGQAFLTGTITSLTSDNAVGPPLTPPFTITIPVRGAGSADMTGVMAGGGNVEIYWYGGQPLPFSGTGTLVIGGGGLAVSASGTTWMLDGAVRSLTTGHFFLGSPVAVGTSGLATPYQTFSFDSGNQSTLVTTGNAQIHQAPADLHITGPGSVTIHGAMQMQTPTATTHVQTVTFGPGNYDITLTPIAGGDTIKATLQGPVSSS
jgi:hypothetical protein